MIRNSFSRYFHVLILALLTVGSAPVSAAPNASVKNQLQADINGSWRAPENRARDKYRHPLQTLMFFGVKPDSTVIELIPGNKLWYAEILAPFLHDHGHYIAANQKSNSEDTGQKDRMAMERAQFDKAEIREFDFNAPDFGPPDSADFFLTFRNVHNFAMNHKEDALFAAIYKVLKPGGVLGVVDHRAADGKTLDEVLKSGYLPQPFVVAAAEKAGFKLVATSDVNRNHKDNTDHPKGVWTLPPTLREGDKDREKYLTIGESDRFTLKFVKPK
ncbi:MAG TPA: hypothetical protein VG962_05140 [Steroidobacteraceae bacterium]|nr:hypothetical protein [Steroidobacteraceae bacterium]